MRRRIFLILVVILFLLPAIGWAGEYVLVKGKGVEVCEEYGKNLNSFYLPHLYVMACERKINPEFTEFKWPEWEEIDLWENRELLKKVEHFLGLQGSYADPDKNIQEWEKILKDRIKKSYMYATIIMISQIDIDNDGKAENVIKYSDGACPGGNYFGAPLIVLNDDKSEVDIEKTKPLLQNPNRSENQPLSAGWRFAMYDVFLHKNKAYFDRWSGDRWIGSKDKIEFLKVFLTETDKKGKISTKEICRYRFSR
ncbi:MAG: hypothetical protein QMD44_06180 [Thermodesulfovibrionales bacterium]|jgi:hypothetical protein|nr:hypothetical protein [Thermodesulfovibrionales bacterium]